MKIVIVDDDILVSSALKTILEAGGEVEVTGTGQDGKDAVRLYDELLPDVLLMDIRMKDMNGLDAAEQILKRHTDAKILLLTTFSDDAYIVKALKKIWCEGISDKTGLWQYPSGIAGGADESDRIRN